jgi:translation initiation factor IF-1
MERDGTMADETAEAIVVEQLPNRTFRVKLANQTLVLAHPAGAAETNFVRMRPGDRVRVAVSPHDRSRGRILELLDER